MKESMIQEALALFEQRGKQAVEEINSIMNAWEYTNSVSEYRKVDKLSSLVEKYGASPEQIVIRKEEQRYLLHFVCWLQTHLRNVKPIMWYIWRDAVIYGQNTKELAKKYQISTKTVNRWKVKCRKQISKALPFYYAQFGNLEEYLKN